LPFERRTIISGIEGALYRKNLTEVHIYWTAHSSAAG